LSVFADGWTLEAAEAVCGDDVLDLLGHLVDKSLVLVDAGSVGDMRYRLLETVRQYAHEKLVESGEAASARDRHLEWFLALAEQAHPELVGPEQVAWLDRLEAEHDNLRAALAWSQTEGGSPEVALRLSGALYRFWGRRGHTSEGRTYLGRALDQDTLAPGRARANALNGTAVLARTQAQHEVARSLFEESLAIFRAVDDWWGVANALHNQAFILLFLDGDEQAAPLVGESVRLWRELGDAWGLATALGIGGQILHRRGDHRGAAALYEESLALFRQVGDTWSIASMLVYLGLLAMNERDHDRAAALLVEGLDLRRSIGNRDAVAQTLLHLATLSRQQGEHERAAARCRGALALYRDAGVTWAISGVLDRLASIAASAGCAAPAARLYGAAGALSRDSRRFVVSTAWTDPDRDRDAARAVLGDAAFEAAWAEGQAMSLDQAIEYAASLSFADPASRRAVHLSTESLTAREREIAALVARGLTNRQIAEELVISKRTASTHVTNVLAKLDFATRAQVAAWAVEQGLAGRS
jgi:DNA-binding CsgD family transcriptional regulator